MMTLFLEYFQMSKHPFFRDSKCIGSWLHRFNIVEEYQDYVKEVCEICHKQIVLKMIMEQLNNQSYMNSHFRSALPPSHPYYYHEHEYSPLSEDKIISPYV